MSDDVPSEGLKAIVYGNENIYSSSIMMTFAPKTIYLNIAF